MRSSLLTSLGVVAALAVFAGPALADVTTRPPPANDAVIAAPQPPADFDKQRLRLLNALRPELRRKVAPLAHEVVRRVDQKPPRGAIAHSPLELSRRVLAESNDLGLGELPNVDVAALVFIVLMEATKDAQDDLKSIMDGVKAINAAKACVRQTQSRAAALRCIKGLKASADLPLAALDNMREALKDKLDSLNEMGETESLRLQMAMDRLSKFHATLSNLMKKIADTDSAIVSNLK